MPAAPVLAASDDDIGDLPFSDEPSGPGYVSMLDEVRRALDERTDFAAPADSVTALTVTLLAVDNPVDSLEEAGWARPLHRRQRMLNWRIKELDQRKRLD
jgi:hypothetical protein